ncbi:GDSL esterase/lipase At1g33811 [Macadamia integrifolia]|uniref:GDSL esterase/lipase At1g33811 n=1 Tax=Macadamia integrifolia TaxID=60698 RepID=UPI001C4EE297|nr:GDSL esterase/lipase At1g33811 [Macadamia integrifolia]
MRGSSDQLVLVISLALVWLCNYRGVTSQNLHDNQVPCFFIFGDSLVDNGNNNGILTLARANYRPYGIDFPQGVTGRFSNGRTTVDVLAQLLGFPDFIPPYSRARGPTLLRGVNYASGASGIRDESGNNLGYHTSMNQQVSNFATTVQQMRRFFRRNDTALYSHLSRCIFYSGLGSNDYLNNYFMPDLYTTSRDFTPKSYATSLLQDYSSQLTELYQLGARKVVVTAVGQIGCIPYELARYNGNGKENSSSCNESINNAIILFNSGLQKLVDHFNKGKFPGARFIYVNLFESSKRLITNAASYGFEVLDKGCCGLGKNNGLLTCLPLQQPCDDRTKYVFWDAFHPTEAANNILARISYASKLCSDAYPMNIQQLAML